METRVPANYKDFRCIGSACRDNCCIGWEIDIDERTAEFYRTVPGELGKRLREDIDWEQQCFRLGEGERCPFLNKKNLCDVIIGLGEEHLCQICDRHPRFRNVLPHYAEMGVGLCCEEAARQLLAYEERMILVPGPKIDEEPGEQDRMLVMAMNRVRQFAFRLVQDREKTMAERMGLLLSLSRELWLSQDDEGGGQLDLLEEYELYGIYPPVPAENVEKEAVWRKISEIFLSLERLDERWTALLEQLPEETAEKDLPETPFEQLVWYFIFRHLSTAEEGDFASRILFAAVSYLVIRRMVLQGGEMEDIVRMYSKEIEYSTGNVDALLDAFVSEECFREDVLAALG